MRFTDFLKACKFLEFGPDGGDSFIFTCIRLDRIPQGSGWGICDEQHCPYFGVKGTNVEINIDGVKVATAKEVRFVLDCESENIV